MFARRMPGVCHRIAANCLRGIDIMELLIVGLILYFGGKWLVKKTGADRPMFICGECKRVSRGFDHCAFCCNDSALYIAHE